MAMKFRKRFLSTTLGSHYWYVPITRCSVIDTRGSHYPYCIIRTSRLRHPCKGVLLSVLINRPCYPYYKDVRINFSTDSESLREGSLSVLDVLFEQIYFLFLYNLFFILVSL